MYSPVYKLRNRQINKNMPGNLDAPAESSQTVDTPQAQVSNEIQEQLQRPQDQLQGVDQTLKVFHDAIVRLTSDHAKTHETIINHVLSERNRSNDSHNNSLSSVSTASNQTDNKLSPRDIPKDLIFSGGENEQASPFLKKLSTFTSYMSLTEQDICKLFPLTLSGRAFSWYHNLPVSVQNNWQQLQDAFLCHYGAQARGFLYETTILDRTQHPKESVHEYASDLARRFDTLGTQDPEKWKWFVRGLQPKIKTYVIQQKCNSFDEAERLAKQAEQIQLLLPQDNTLPETLATLFDKLNVATKSETQTTEQSTRRDLQHQPRHTTHDEPRPFCKYCNRNGHFTSECRSVSHYRARSTSRPRPQNHHNYTYSRRSRYNQGN